MIRFKNFAQRRPFLFGLVLILIYALLGMLTYPAHFLFPETDAGQLYGDALSKFTSFLVVALIIWRFGWLKASGLAKIGSAKMWLIASVVLVYLIFGELYAFTGDLKIVFPTHPIETASLMLSLSTGFIEETLFRGLALVAMLIAWGDTKKGQLKAILLSATFFGLMHLANLMIRPPGVVIFQALIVILPGIFYAAFLLTYRSLWPVIIIHGLTNAVVNIKAITNPDYQEAFLMWIIFGAVLIPVMIYSVYLIWKLPDRYQIDDV